MAVIYEYACLTLDNMGFSSCLDVTEGNVLEYENIFESDEYSESTSVSCMAPSAGLRNALNSVVVEVDVDSLLARLNFVGCSGYIKIIYVNDITSTERNIQTVIRSETLPFKFILIRGVSSQLIQYEFGVIRDILLGEGRQRASNRATWHDGIRAGV